MLGMWLRGVLPEHHLDAETKDVVKLGVGLIGTMAALLLGLLVASAKSSYDARSSELTQVAANIILLDRILAHYGTETGEIRGILKMVVARRIDQIWPKDGKEKGGVSSKTGGEIIFDKIQAGAAHRRSAHAPIAGRVDHDQLGTDAMALVCAERDSDFHTVPCGGSFLACHAFRELRLICAAQRDCNRHAAGECDIGCGCDVFDL